MYNSFVIKKKYMLLLFILASILGFAAGWIASYSGLLILPIVGFFVYGLGLLFLFLLLSFITKAFNPKEKIWIRFLLLLWVYVGIVGSIGTATTFTYETNKELNYDMHEGQNDDRKAALILQAIQQYQREKGKMPADLSVLIPNYLKTIPTTATGATYEYGIPANDPSNGFFLMYPRSPHLYKYYDSISNGWSETDPGQE